MIFSPQIEQWRSMVTENAGDIPVDPILALIQHESGGDPKRLSKRSTLSSYTPLELKCGWPHVWRANAIGLMQVTPILLRDYNQRYKTDISPCSLYNTPNLQIKIGTTYLTTCLKWTHSLDPKKYIWPHGPLRKSQLKIALLCYARGIGAMKKKVAELRAAGVEFSFENLQARYPDFGVPEKPYQFAILISRVLTDSIEPHDTATDTEKKKLT